MTFSRCIISACFCLFVLLFICSPVEKSHAAHLLSEYAIITNQQTITTSDLLNNKSLQLSNKNNKEHLNCLRHVGQRVFYYVAKTPKAYSESAPRDEDVLVKKLLCRHQKTTHALGLSYEFTRLNVLSSKSHPPTYIISLV